VTSLDTFINREHQCCIGLRNIRSIGKLSCDADDINFPDLTTVRDATLKGRRIHLPMLCTADIFAIHNCPTVVLPNLAGVEDLSLPDTKVFIAPRLKRVGWWNNHNFETVVSGPDYAHHSYEKADHHVLS
jgi:hypothetical protein